MLWLAIYAIVGSVMIQVSVASAATVAFWDRNPEPDMDHYNVYSCPTQGCAPDPTSSPKASIGQTPSGTKPEWPLPPNEQGMVAVSAVDNSGNESALSTPVFFDRLAPSVPQNVGTR